MSEKESWLSKVLAIKDSRQSCWLIDSTADVHIWNDKKLMSNFVENLTKVGGSNSNSILLGRGKVIIRLGLKDGTEGLVLILTNVLYLPNSPFNLVGLSLLNNAKIYYHNKDQILYNLEIWKTLAFAEQYKTSFFLHPINLSVAAMNLFKNNKLYQKEITNVNQTKHKKLSLVRWHQRLGYLNFTSLRKYFVHHKMIAIDDTKDYVCNSCEKTKVIKRYN